MLISPENSIFLVAVLDFWRDQSYSYFPMCLEKNHDFSIDTYQIFKIYENGKSWVNKDSNDTKFNGHLFLESSNTSLEKVADEYKINTLRVWIIIWNYIMV